MSIIFGIRRQEGMVVNHEEIHSLASATKRYAPDGMFLATHGNIGMGFQPYHTHVRSRLETQPIIDDLGNMLVFDGRFDNWHELWAQLGIQDRAVADSTIALTAFGRWGEHCFSQFIGDWALVLWSAIERVVYLARDHAGTRTLYFTNIHGVVRWSTYLETLIHAEPPSTLDEDYLACYLALQPIRDLTPYNNIRAVLPAHYVAIRDGKLTKKKHWDWMLKTQIHYKTDQEYDEHFLSLFQQSVERRDEPNTPVVAELSGGMDSSSIVCISDRARNIRGSSHLIDTISYYRESEPNWNERPYFSIVEAMRRKVGIHIDVSPSHPAFSLQRAEHSGYLLPANPRPTIELENRLALALRDRGFRAFLSGIGGDEVLGGVPTLLPELAGHLVSGSLVSLFKRSMQLCVLNRVPILSSLAETVDFTCHLYRRPRLKRQDCPSWISPQLYERCLALQQHDLTASSRLGLSPNSISCGLTWWCILETLPHLYPLQLSRYEFRYPYLDRDLVEYLYQVPREQLVQPGRRRHLMRRALRHIVPTEILERRRKAFIIRGPLSVIQREGPMLKSLIGTGWLANSGYIDPAAALLALDRTIAGTRPELWPGLMKLATFEMWLPAIGLTNRTISASRYMQPA